MRLGLDINSVRLKTSFSHWFQTNALEWICLAYNNPLLVIWDLKILLFLVTDVLRGETIDKVRIENTVLLHQHRFSLIVQYAKRLYNYCVVCMIFEFLQKFSIYSFIQFLHTFYFICIEYWFIEHWIAAIVGTLKEICY